MAADLNSCNFIGRLGRDVEMKTMSNGDQMAVFSLAVGESYTNKQGEKVKNTEWVNCVCYRKLAEICGKYLGKGSQVYVSGKMNTTKYTGKDGSEKWSTKIIIDTMQMLGTKHGHENDAEPVKSIDDASFNPELDVPF